MLTNSSFFTVQIYASGVSNCRQWTAVNTEAKLVAFSAALINYFRNQSNCPVQATYVNQSMLKCFDDRPSYVTFRASLIWYSNLSEQRVIKILANWTSIQKSLLIEGDVLQLSKSCPIEISGFNETQCSSFHSLQKPTLLLLANLSVFSAVILIISVSSILACLKCKRYYTILLRALNIIGRKQEN